MVQEEVLDQQASLPDELLPVHDQDSGTATGTSVTSSSMLDLSSQESSAVEVLGAPSMSQLSVSSICPTVFVPRIE